MSEITAEEWDALEIKYEYSQRLISCIIKGPAVAFLNENRKRKKSHSRGDYISNCIVQFEKGNSMSKLKVAEDEAFALQLRVYELERILRDNGIEI